MKRPLEADSSDPASEEVKKAKASRIMDADEMRALMEQMSKTVSDNITKNLGASLSDLTNRVTTIESTTRIIPAPAPVTPVIDLSSSTPKSTPSSRGQGRGRGAHRGRGRNNSSTSDSSISSSGGHSGGRGRGKVHKNRKNERISGMTRGEYEKMVSNVILNYDQAKEVAAREIILKGMTTGNDLETATTHLRLIDPSFSSFEIDEIQRFAKPDASGVPPMKVTLKRRAMANRINDLIELAGEEGAPWASASLPWLVRQKNRLTLKDIGDLNAKLPVNPSKHWEKKVIGGHVLKKYKPNPGFNKDVVAPNLLPGSGASAVTAEQARLAMIEIQKTVAHTGPKSKGASASNISPPTPSEDSQVEPMITDQEDPDIETWTPEYRAKIYDLLREDIDEENSKEEESKEEDVPKGSQTKKSPRPTRRTAKSGSKAE